MGDQNTGGGGSVHWHINVKNQKPVFVSHKDDGRFHTYGADEGGTTVAAVVGLPGAASPRPDDSASLEATTCQSCSVVLLRRHSRR